MNPDSTDQTPSDNSPSTYTAAEGDTLGSIAEDRGLSLEELQRLNPQIISPDAVFPGQTIYLASDTSAKPSDEGVTSTSPSDDTGPISPLVDAPAPHLDPDSGLNDESTPPPVSSEPPAAPEPSLPTPSLPETPSTAPAPMPGDEPETAPAPTPPVDAPPSSPMPSEGESGETPPINNTPIDPIMESPSTSEQEMSF